MYETELINLIRESEDPAKAIITAVQVIIDYINSELSPKITKTIDGKESA